MGVSQVHAALRPPDGPSSSLSVPASTSSLPARRKARASRIVAITATGARTARLTQFDAQTACPTPTEAPTHVARVGGFRLLAPTIVPPKRATITIHTVSS